MAEQVSDKSPKPGIAERQLIIIMNPGSTEFVDFHEIAKEVTRQAPDIAVYIATPFDNVATVPPHRWKLPVLTVAIGTKLGRFVPVRGRSLENRAYKKLEQFSRFVASGVRTPLTERFAFGKVYDEEKWGKLVILKPLSLTLTSKGGSVRLFRTRSLHHLKISDLPDGHALKKGPALVQQFVDTGIYPSKWRVLSLLGEPLYSAYSVSALPRIDLTADDATIADSIVEPRTPENKEVDVHGLRDRLMADEEVLAFARRIHAAFPSIPLLGIDVLRREQDGELFALEVNAGGNVWHFSSYAKQHRARLGGRQNMVDQFGAWAAAARTLVRATRELAS